MGLMTAIVALCIFLSTLLISSSAHSSHTLRQFSHSQEIIEAQKEIMPLVWPRKLRRMLKEAKVKADGLPVSEPNYEFKQKENISGSSSSTGNSHNEEETIMRIHASSKGRRNRAAEKREKTETETEVVADKSSPFFAMDYVHVRRRRPVHNMSINRP